MRLTEFVRHRITEDELLARATDPPDEALLHICQLARTLLEIADRQQGELSRRQHAVLLDVAKLYERHADFDPRWRPGVPPGVDPDDLA